MSVPSNSGFDPYVYTSGRWLRRDDLERRARYIQFDFEALSQRVIELCPGASSIQSCDKKEGGFNRVFIFTMDNGKRIVARLPFSLAGPARLTTLSEVATIQYIQANTSIPIPKVLDWSDDASTLGSEYIIMEHVEGVQLTQRWPHMEGDQQIKCIGAIFQKLKEVSNINFPAYGSLYHADADINSGCKIPLDKGFCLGPHCGPSYWNCTPGEPRYYQRTTSNRGPWLDLQSYGDGLVDAGIARLPPDPELLQLPRYQGLPAEHVNLLDSGRAVIRRLSRDSRVLDAATPMLFHPDLHKRNIFVAENDPTVVTGIIDWQSTSIEPAFWYSNEVPDFARCKCDPSGENDFNSELCAKAFDGCIRLLVPKLAVSRSMDESLFRPFQYCYRTWKDGIVAFRHELIELSRRWADLGLDGSCPFVMCTDDVLTKHREHFKRFVAAHDLKRDLSSLLDTTSDGWVRAGDWEVTLLAYDQMYSRMLEAVLTHEDPGNDEVIKNESDLREIWPFDL